MTQLTRRDAIGLSVGLAGAFGLAQADDHPAAPAKTAAAAGIDRYDPSPSLAGIPLISNIVVHRDLAYLSGITATKPGDIKDQTREVLARIDALLAKVGSHKSKLLTTQVWLTDMSLFAAHNDAWNEWVDPQNRPVRACLNSPQLWHTGLLVEIMATAAI